MSLNKINSFEQLNSIEQKKDDFPIQSKKQIFIIPNQNNTINIKEEHEVIKSENNIKYLEQQVIKN